MDKATGCLAPEVSQRYRMYEFNDCIKLSMLTRINYATFSKNIRVLKYCQVNFIVATCKYVMLDYY